MEIPLDDCEDCQKPQIKDASLIANMSDIHKTSPGNSLTFRRFRARSCKHSKPAEKIIIDLTEDDKEDTTVACTKNQSNDQIAHTDDACYKDGDGTNSVSKVVKGTRLQVPKAEVQELQRGSDMHEFLLCLGSNVLKDITCNGGWGFVNTDRKATAAMTENRKTSSFDDTYRDKMKEERRHSGKYAPSGSNIVSLGKRKTMASQPDREDPCDSGWDIINDMADTTDTWKGVDEGHTFTNPANDGPGLWAGKLEKQAHSDDGWGVPIEDQCKATIDDGWGTPSDDPFKPGSQEKSALIQTPWSAANKSENKEMLSQGSEVPNADNVSLWADKLGKQSHSDDGWGVPIEDQCKATIDDGWGTPSDDAFKPGSQEKSALIQTPWSAANKSENKEMLSQGSEVPNADNVMTAQNPWDCAKSEIREQIGKISFMNDFDGDDMNVDMRRSGKYAPSGANLVPLGKRKMTNRPVMKDSCVSGWTSINEEAGCTDKWEVSDKTNNTADLTIESPSWVNRFETDLPCDDGWGGSLEMESQSGSVWGNASEDQHKVTTQAANDSYGGRMKKEYPENNNHEERHSGRYEASGANLQPLGKRERYMDLWDPSMCPTEPSEVLDAVKVLANSMRKILHRSGYNIGDKLKLEDQTKVVENALLYHPDKDNKIGCGVDYIMIDTHPDHQNAQCFFIVRKDGSRSDFSYWKCVKGLVQDKYPDHAKYLI